MDLGEVDAAKTIDGRLGCLNHGASGESPGIGRKFGSEADLVFVGTIVGLAKFSEEEFALAFEFACAVGVSGIKERDAPIDAAIEYLLQFSIHTTIVTPKNLVSPGPRSASHLRELQCWFQFGFSNHKRSQ